MPGRLLYRVIEGPTRANRDQKQFHEQVEEALREGWSLWGGVACDSHYHRLFQAVVLREFDFGDGFPSDNKD